MRCALVDRLDWDVNKYRKETTELEHPHHTLKARPAAQFFNCPYLPPEFIHTHMGIGQSVWRPPRQWLRTVRRRKFRCFAVRHRTFLTEAWTRCASGAKHTAPSSWTQPSLPPSREARSVLRHTGDSMREATRRRGIRQATVTPAQLATMSYGRFHGPTI